MTRLDGADFAYEEREAARHWFMTPSAFRALPPGDRVEMMAHRRESNLRKDHAEKVSADVAKEFAEKEKNQPGT